MKKVGLWALGIILFLGSLGHVTSSTTAVKETSSTPVPTKTMLIEPTKTPVFLPTATPTLSVRPTSAPLPIYSAPACSGTAICRDGSCSYSAHRQGTCSHHGGVAEWL